MGESRILLQDLPSHSALPLVLQRQHGNFTHSSLTVAVALSCVLVLYFARPWATACHEWFISQILVLSSLTKAWVRGPPKTVCESP